MSGSQQQLKLPIPAAVPKKITLIMNKNSHRPRAALRKGIASPGEQRDEVFFQTVKPLIHGNTFLIEMSSGTHIE